MAVDTRYIKVTKAQMHTIKKTLKPVRELVLYTVEYRHEQNTFR